MSTKPYLPTTQPMRGEEQNALMDILGFQGWGSREDRLRTANTILAEGFARTLPRKVTKAQLWTYFIEAVLLGICAHVVHGTGEMFVYGILVALTAGSAITFTCGLIINHAIKIGFRK